MATAPVTNRERERMREMRAGKMSLSAIGAELGRSARCVHDHVKDIPVHCRHGRPGMNDAAKARMLAAHAAGVGKDDLARRFGIQPQSVHPTLTRLRKLQQVGALV